MEFNFQTTFNRQRLQGYAEEMRKAEEAARRARMQIAVKQRVDAISPMVLNAAKASTTFYLYVPTDPNWCHHHQSPEFTNDDLQRGLQEKFPECIVTLAEEWVDVPPPSRAHNQPPTRVLKSGIKIDWS